MEHITALTILWGCLAMAFKDALGTLLVIAEARGRSNLAGWMDAGGDMAQVLVNVIGAGAVIKYGWDYKTMGVLGAMMLTSYIGTRFWTNFGKRYLGDDQAKLLVERLAKVEAALLAHNIPL